MVVMKSTSHLISLSPPPPPTKQWIPMRAILCHPNDTFSLIIQSMKCVGPSVLLDNITAQKLLSLVVS